MHHYLRAIGFSKLRTLSEINELLHNIIEHPTSRSITTVGSGITLAQFTREYGDAYGISIVGEYNENNRFIAEYYFPFIMGTMPKQEDTVFIESNSDKESYSGVSENTNVAIPLIFFLQNVTDYVRCTWSNEYNRPLNQVSYGGLSTSGKVLLGVDKDEEQIQDEKSGQMKRSCLITAAKEGDADAIESLTLEDIDLYSSISKRARTEDIYSIVDSTIIPYGVNSEQYSIVGTIQEYKQVENPVTKERLYKILINANEIYIDIMIHSSDLLGEPAVGRRFKGTVWLQGYVFCHRANNPLSKTNGYEPLFQVLTIAWIFYKMSICFCSSAG